MFSYGIAPLVLSSFSEEYGRRPCVSLIFDAENIPGDELIFNQDVHYHIYYFHIVLYADRVVSSSAWHVILTSLIPQYHFLGRKISKL